MAKKNKIKEKKIKNGKHICDDDTKGKFVRIISKHDLPDTEITKHLKRHK